MGLFDLFKKKKQEPESPQLTTETHVVPKVQDEPMPSLVSETTLVSTKPKDMQISIHPSFTLHDDIKDLLWIGDGPFKNFSKEDDYEILKSFKIGTIEGDMLYRVALASDEPSLIYTDLPANKPDDVSLIPRPPYFPKYYQLTPEQRWIYLSLLVNPYNTAIDIGYVFILYYGLERHLLKGNFEKAFAVILKLRDIHTNKSFQDYSAHALILTSMIHQKGEYAFLFLKSLDKAHEFNFSPNLLLMLYVSFGVSLTAPEIMRMAKTFEFTNTNYIKKYPDIFLECLTGVITDKTGGDSIDLKKYFSNTKLAKIPVYDTMVFANSSIANASVPVPLLCQDFALKKDMFNLLEVAHEKVKVIIAGSRKKGTLVEVAKPAEAQIKKPVRKLDPPDKRLFHKPKTKTAWRLHSFYSEQIIAFYARRNEKPEYLELAIKACEDQIAISKEVAKEMLKDRKSFKMKPSDQFSNEILRKYHLVDSDDEDDTDEDKYEGIDLPEGFNPSIHISPDDFEIIPGRLYEHTGFKQLCIIREKEGNYEEVIRLSTRAKEEGWVGDWDKRIEKAKKKLEQGNKL